MSQPITDPNAIKRAVIVFDGDLSALPVSEGSKRDTQTS